MPYKDLRQFLDVLRQHNELEDINGKIDLSDIGKALKQSYHRQYGTAPSGAALVEGGGAMITVTGGGGVTLERGDAASYVRRQRWQGTSGHREQATARSGENGLSVRHARVSTKGDARNRRGWALVGQSYLQK